MAAVPRDGDTLSLVVVGSERAGASSRYPSTCLVPAILESGCRLGQRMSPRRRKPGAGPDPKCPTENHPRSLLFPMARSPLPLRQIFHYPWPVATPNPRGVTLFAGSTCRQGASDPMPSISTTSTRSALQIAVSPRIQFMLPSTPAVPLWVFNPSLLRPSEGGHWTLP